MGNQPPLPSTSDFVSQFHRDTPPPSPRQQSSPPPSPNNSSSLSNTNINNKSQSNIENNNNNNNNPSSSHINKPTKELTNESNTNTNTNTNNTQQAIKEETLYPIKIEWKEGGSEHLITGNFLNWNIFYSLVFNSETGNYEYNINLPKGNYEFKFIIDGTWRCSKYYPIIRDRNGNANNYIEVNDTTINATNTKKNNTNNNEPKIKNDYNCYCPKVFEMNTDAPYVPFHYLHKYNIDYNTRQNVIGKRKYLIYNEKNLLSENNSYKKVLTCPHVNLNHNCSHCKMSKRYFRTCISQRVRHKFLTVVYYVNYKDAVS